MAAVIGKHIELTPADAAKWLNAIHHLPTPQQPQLLGNIEGFPDNFLEWAELEF
ncbi:MAG: hypothetical protein R3A13_08885 [Bdellovibrionota bacterium]